MSVAPIRQLKNRTNRFEPYEHEFTYTGAMQTWIVPSTGIYQIELYGGRAITGSRGAYVKSYHKLTKNEVLYIGCGGEGPQESEGSVSIHYTNGGWNGGGIGGGYFTNNYRKGYFGAGGGATHVSKENVAIGSTVLASNILCVAGGGGGSAHWTDAEYGGGDRSASSSANGNNTLGDGATAAIEREGYGAGGGGLQGGKRGYAGTNKAESYGGYTATSTQGTNSDKGKVKITRVE